MRLALCFTLPREFSIALLEWLRESKEEIGSHTEKGKRLKREKRKSGGADGGGDKCGFPWLQSFLEMPR